MSKEVNEELLRFKNLKVLKDVPEDLSKVIETFIEQAVILGEYDLPYMPPEYVENLLRVCSKYPKYNGLLLELISLLKRDNNM